MILIKVISRQGSGNGKSYHQILDNGELEEGNAKIRRKYIIRIENLSVL